MGTVIKPPLSIPLAPGVWATLTLAWPITPEEWDQLMATLAVMRVVLVDPATARTPPAREGSGSDVG